MTKRKQNTKRQPAGLGRIERKCDRILSELLIIRQQLSRRPDIDTAIERLHHAARSMRAQSERERDCFRRMSHSKLTE